MTSDIPWDDIRREYVAGERTQLAIADAYGVSRHIIKRRADKEGWGPRQKKLAPSEVSVKKLAHKLEGALAMHIHTQQSIEELGPADRERAARTLSSLVRTLEKLNTIKPEDEAGDDFPRDLATLRQELAERPEKLRGREPEKPGSEPSERVQRGGS